MSLQLIFEDFSAGPIASSQARSSSVDPLEGYETGYKAGWDDAITAQQGSKTHLSTALTQNLEQIEFTLAEANAGILTSLKPVLNEIASTLLPGLSNTALRNLIVEEIGELLNGHSPEDISIDVSPEDETAIAALLDTTHSLSKITLVAKTTLGAGQAYVSCAAIQRKIDVGQAITDIQSTIEKFLNQPELEQLNAV